MPADAVLVSGGIGGIGSALCRELASGGYHAIIGYRTNAFAARSLAEEVDGIAVELDLTSNDSIAAAMETILALPHPLVGIVLAASPPPVIAPLFEIADEDFALQWRVNVEAPRRLLDGLVRSAMRPRRKGWVVGILSRAMGVEGKAAKNMGSYVIAKYGQQGLLKAVESEYPWLRVVAILPDYTETNMLKAFDARFLELLRARCADGRFAAPGAVAREIMVRIRELQ